MTAENVVIGPGAKIFEQLFCEAFLGPGRRRAGLQPVLSDVPAEHRPSRRAGLAGGPAFRRSLPAAARRGRAVSARRSSSQGHLSQQPPQSDRRRGDRRGPARPWPTWCAAATSPSSATSPTTKWCGAARHRDAARRAGHARPMRRRLHVQQVVQHERLSAGLRRQRAAIIERLATLLNTTLSCVPPLVQLAGTAAAICMIRPSATGNMQRFAEQVQHPGRGLASIPEVRCEPPDGTFYVFPDVTRDLQSAGPDVAWAGDVFARSGRRPDGAGVPGGRVLWRGRRGFPAIQLRRDALR